MAALDEIETCSAVCERTAAEGMQHREAERMREIILCCHACADICDASGRSLARLRDDRIASLPHILERCVAASTRCAQRCGSDPGMHILRICRDQCLRTARRLRDLARESA
ncbi:MAG: hypothetical protein HKO57_11695 [Akkermansiaceae bacterium]|nr:hypothetical protein [Akkermansiaceae bacterium]